MIFRLNSSTKPMGASSASKTNDSSGPLSCRESRRSSTLSRSLALSVLCTLAAWAGCSGNDRHPGMVADSQGTTTGTIDGCAFSNTGCPCGEAGATAECGTVKEVVGDELMCLVGQRTCTDGIWGPCVGQRTVNRVIPSGKGLYHAQALASTATSCGNICDPQCKTFVDDSTGVDAGNNILATPDAGMTVVANGTCGTIVIPDKTITLKQSGAAGCTSATDCATVAALSNPLPNPRPTVTLTATCGSGGAVIAPQWRVDPLDADRATINASTGVLTLAAPIARDITVYASTSAATGTGTGKVHVKIDYITDDGNATCNSATVKGYFSSPSGNDTGAILYPYSIPARPVIFPQNMTAPLVQWSTGGTYASPNYATCIKATLCFPSGTCNDNGTTTADNQFHWSKIYTGASSKDPMGPITTTQPALALQTNDQAIWNLFSMSSEVDPPVPANTLSAPANSNNADIQIQRIRNSTTSAYRPMTASIRFASDAIRGTIYYTQYKANFNGWTSTNYLIDPSTGKLRSGYSTPSCPVGNNTHNTSAGGSTIMSLKTATYTATPPTPVDIFGGNAGCPVCHSVSADGLKLATTGHIYQREAASSVANSSSGFNRILANGTVTGISDVPQYSFPWDSFTYATATNFPSGGGTEPFEDSRGWAYAPITPDGHYVLQGPNYWGNTTDIGATTNNTQSAAYNLSTAGANKRYFLVDTTSYIDVVDYATSTALPANTATATTLTASANGALSLNCLFATCSSLSGRTLLVWNERNPVNNGIYLVTDAGAAGRSWILTRSLFDASGTVVNLANDQRIRVDSGKAYTSSFGSLSNPLPVYFRVTTTGAIVPGTTPINFALYTTVRAATTATLPNNPTLSGDFLTASSNAAFPTAIDGVPIIKDWTRILVQDQADTRQNGIYTLTTTGSGSAKWQLTRSVDLDVPTGVILATSAALPNGPTLSGSTLAASSNGALAIQVQNQSNSSYNGYYTITNMGSGSTKWVLSKSAATSASIVTIADLPSCTLNTSVSPNTLTSTVNSAFTNTVVVQHQAAATENGYYTIANAGGSSAKYSLTTTAGGTGALGYRIRVTEGIVNGGNEFELSSATTNPVVVGGSGLTFTAATSTGAGLGSSTMMVPEFSPQGNQLIYVAGDADTIAGYTDSGWRRGLTLMDFNAATKTFSNKRRLVNNWNSSTPGNTIKWPFFEPGVNSTSTSFVNGNSVIYVEGNPTDFCPPGGNWGNCTGGAINTATGEVSGLSCGSAGSTGSIDTDIERACFQGTYGNMSPTTRGYFLGKLRSVNTTTPSNNPSSTNPELAYINSNNGAMDVSDANRAYQPTVLPFIAGGYRWVIFTSQRSYGNQYNEVGTDRACRAPLLWMAALDNVESSAGDRSYPAFLVPGQNIRNIVPAANDHFVNERGYLVPSVCVAAGGTCSVTAECCGNPTMYCDSGTHQCTAKACNFLNDACSASSPCCSGYTCTNGFCSSPPLFSTATFSRDYHADCSQSSGQTGYHAAWGDFSWHAAATGTTSIGFAAQSDDTGSFTGAAIALGQANSSNVNAPPATANYANVGTTWAAATSTPAGDYLRVTMTFNPSTDFLSAPTLYDWNVTYTCVPTE